MANKKKSDEELKILEEQAKAVRNSMKTAIDNLDTREVIAFRDVIANTYGMSEIDAIKLIIKKFNKKEFTFKLNQFWS